MPLRDTEPERAPGFSRASASIKSDAGAVVTAASARGARRGDRRSASGQDGPRLVDTFRSGVLPGHARLLSEGSA